MAATDQTYRSQKTLDIVFAVSCVLMLLSTVLMFALDHYGWDKTVPWKPAQRKFRDVEVAVNEQQMLQQLPSSDEVKAKVQAAAKAREEYKAAKERLASKELELSGKRDLDDTAYRMLKAEYDSTESYHNIAVEHLGKLEGKEHDQFQEQLAQQTKKLDQVRERLRAARDKLDKTEREIREQVANELRPYKDRLDQAEDDLKKLTGAADRFAKTAVQKDWGVGDWFRGLPILDGFASPYKINQIALNDLTIDYGGFRDVPRYDRCTTCHLAIERPAYDRQALSGLAKSSPELQDRLNAALEMFEQRQKAGEDLGFKVKDLPQKVTELKLKPYEIGMYAAHPRLELFVDPNSPHPMQKFGCTICHDGQGSGTDFALAAHSPADSRQQEEWEKEYHYHPSHFWDFPMLSSRFVESGCLKCHPQITDLITHGSKQEAPKLLRGYKLLSDNGCFGCHEIASIKSGKVVGPDIRLEPGPALEYLSPADQEKVKADPLNPPGTYRKVGPGLRRLAEKTNQGWARKWILAPRNFREDTKMPHFYGLSNNREDVLPEAQKNFPATEIHSIAYYLFAESQGLLKGDDTARRFLKAQLHDLHDQLKKEPLDVKKRKELDDVTRKLTDLALLTVASRANEINSLAAQLKQAQLRLQEKQPAPELDELTKRLIDAGIPVPVEKQLYDGEGTPVTLPDKQGDPANGKKLFTERGCLACHSHDKSQPAGEANFGPNLSRLAAKILPEVGGEKAKRRWLVQWVLNPNVHFSRTRMPVTHLTVEQAADVAEWLLAQGAQGWDEKDPPAPERKDLIDLARVYLLKAPGMTRADVDKYLPTEGEAPGLPDELLKTLTDLKVLAPDAEEHRLGGGLTDEKLKWYIGKKSIGRLGCYGCHDIPGFEASKPIGTALNDWGRKDPARIAFEDADAFVRGHFNIVEARDDKDDPRKPAADWHDKDGKPPFEKFFYEALEHHQRDGFLHLKLAEPRSYDYGRIREWDDRLRMPQFAFARSKKNADESDEDYKVRQEREEAEAREAVMTFVLGLVGEPMGKFIHDPKPDRAAEVRGRQVLEKFNCGGCHQLRPGVYEFKPTPDALKQLEQSYEDSISTFAADYFFMGHNAWQGASQPSPDRMIVYGTQPRKVEKGNLDNDDNHDLLLVRLSEALRFTNAAGVVRDIRAKTMARLIYDNDTGVSRHDPYGGTFAELMTGYMRDAGIERDADKARNMLPPPLIREGERVQPNWLYQFLLNPKAIRPQVILRMPRFNMSAEEATALTNSFAAVDRLNNPGAGLTKEFVAVEQRSDDFWRSKTEAYVRQLGNEKVAQRLKELQPTWEMVLKDRVNDLERRLAAAEAAVKQATGDDAKKAAEEARAAVEKSLKEAKEKLDKKDFKDLDEQWKTRDAYAADGYRLLFGHAKGVCFTCHIANGVGAAQGPPLDVAFERLRPEWTLKWIGNPARMFAYNTVMPVNFPSNERTSQELFDGPPLEQIMAIRDVLMNFPRVAELPANRFYRLGPVGGK
jgi:mono/diheme cytochrome c family protein